MKNIQIAKNYALALFTSAAESGVAAEILEQITSINDAINIDIDVKTAIESPIIANTDKIKVLEPIIKKFKINTILIQFLLLLLKNSRISFLPKIIFSYNLLLDESNNTKIVQVISCKILESAEQEWIKTYLESYLGQKVRIKFFQDKSIIGGIIIEYDSIRIDYSILGALNKIKKITAIPKIDFLVG